MVLVMLTAWPWLFFGLERTGWAMLTMAGVIALALMCWRAFSLLSKPATILMTPCVLWLVYVLVLNVSLWAGNGGGIGSLI